MSMFYLALYRLPEAHRAADTVSIASRIRYAYGVDSVVAAKRDGYPNGYPSLFGGATRNRTGE